MTVRVAFQLRRRPAIGPARASALFVPGRDAAGLLALCTRLGVDPSGRVHDVADGFLLKLERPMAEPVPGVTRLRELAANLYIPVDAELVPSLLDDETAGLVRDGGLVLLPGGSTLRFDRQAAVGLEALLVAAPRPRRAWRAMPVPRRLAERITEVARVWPDPPEDPYSEWEQELRRPGSTRRDRGEPDPGEATDRDAAGPEGAETSAAGGFASGLHGVGDAVRGMIDRAGAGARSFREKIQWGMLDHSALVQKLLREFRHGDPGRALRHAFPMSPPDPRDRTTGWGNSLPWSRAIYNLFDLLGRPTRGQPVGTWQARPDLIEELKREYRQAAERAIRQGDFRRAAYIYGKLLGDDRMAAQALQRGGLHHDAAILYLKKLNDKAAAAQAFEAAGEVDRAIALYRDLGQHEAAGDLLRRLGDDGRAVEEYHEAVLRHMGACPPEWFEVGRLFSYKIGTPEPAIEAFGNGWGQRPAANATACALELVVIHAARGEIEPIRNLLDEADDFFQKAGSGRDAEAFYNRMAVIAAAAPALAASADEVRDRALRTLSHHLRRQVEAGCPVPPSVSALFGEPSLWSSAFVRDAQFAASAVAARSRDRSAAPGRNPETPGVRVGHGTVTAACQAPATAELFLGFAGGKVLAFRPGRNQVVAVGEGAGSVAAMSADPDGQLVVALHRTEQGSVLTVFHRRPDGTFGPRPDVHFPGHLRSWLTPISGVGPESLIGLGDGRELLILDATAGLPRGRVPLAAAQEPPTTALLLLNDEGYRVLTHDGPRWILLDHEGRCIGRSEPAWRPVTGGRHPQCWVPVSWIHLKGVVKAIGLDEHGAVHATQLWIEDRGFEVLTSPVATTDGGYLAVAPCGHDRVVAVAPGRIDWLTDRSDRFQMVRSIQDPGLAATLACFPSTVPEEVLVVSADGWVNRFTSRRPRY